MTYQQFSKLKIGKCFLKPIASIAEELSEMGLTLRLRKERSVLTGIGSGKIRSICLVSWVPLFLSKATHLSRTWMHISDWFFLQTISSSRAGTTSVLLPAGSPTTRPNTEHERYSVCWMCNKQINKCLSYTSLFSSLLLQLQEQIQSRLLFGSFSILPHPLAFLQPRLLSSSFLSLGSF